MKRGILLYIIFSLLFSCKSGREYFGSITSKKTYEVGKDIFPLNSINGLFNVHLTTLDSRPFIVFLNDKGRIVMQGTTFAASEKYDVDFSPFLAKLDYFSVRLIQDSLYLLDISHRQLLKFLLAKQGISLISSLNLANLFDWEKHSLLFQINNCFEIYPPYLYLPYAITDPKSNYRDTSAYLKIKLIDDSSYQVTNRVLFYPGALKKNTARDTYPILIRMSDTTFAYGFEANDSIYLYNPETNRITRENRFEENFNYRKFKPSKIGDLSYVRWFDQTSEMNYKILFDQKKNLVIIRKLEKNKLTEPDSFAYYVLDTNLKVKIANTFPFSIDPFFCFSYEKGILVFNKDRTKAYYYEID